MEKQSCHLPPPVLPRLLLPPPALIIELDSRCRHRVKLQQSSPLLAESSTLDDRDQLKKVPSPRGDAAAPSGAAAAVAPRSMSSAPYQQSRLIGSNSGPIYSLLSAALPTARPSNPARRTALPQTAAAAHFLPLWVGAAGPGALSPSASSSSPLPSSSLPSSHDDGDDEEMMMVIMMIKVTRI